MLVCEAQVPFVHGGAEVHVRQLVRELRARGFETELVSVPFKWYPKEEILPHAAAWRLLDLSESNGRPIDLVIGTEVPVLLRPASANKMAWLIHQYRAAYELCGTEYSDFAHTELDVGLRDTLMRLDTEMLGECRAVFTNARNTASRLEKFNGLSAEALYHPPQLAPRLVPGPYGDYVLSVGRIESVKRVDLHRQGDARASIRPVRLIVAGDGTQRQNAERAAEPAGVADRVTFLGSVGDDDLIGLYAGALAVAYPPYRRGFRLRHARGVPRAQAGRHLLRLRRPERVRRRRRQRFRVCAGARAKSPRRSTGSRATGRARRRWATRGTDGRADHLGRRDREAHVIARIAGIAIIARIPFS